MTGLLLASLFLTVTSIAEAGLILPASNELIHADKGHAEFNVYVAPYSAIETEEILTNQQSILIGNITFMVRFGFSHENSTDDARLQIRIHLEGQQVKRDYTIVVDGNVHIHNNLGSADNIVSFHTVFTKLRKISPKMPLLTKKVILDKTNGWYDPRRDLVSITVKLDY
jgi:DMSO/TMAO reductase YedYZ molybdopterin-dependent catalytic subunit